jgi:ubiquinone/menaquinone biosynthesis C-methylase UbiE
MKTMLKIFYVIRYTYIFPISPIIYIYGIINKIIGMRFDSFGRLLGLKLITRGGVLQGFIYSINPVSIVRYFEFDFVDRSINWKSEQQVLDVSSPRLFSLYVEKMYNANVTMINPDTRDLIDTKKISGKLSYSKINLFDYDVRNLPFKDESFDCVYSISVIEHIANNEDTKALLEMWRVLKPGGSLVITVPYDQVFAEEYRDVDVYTTTKTSEKGKYFFQRRYSYDSLMQRIIKPLGEVDVKYEYFLENEKGFFDKYNSLWSKKKYLLSVFDPIFIYKNYHIVDDVSNAKTPGIVGVLITKRVNYEK